MSDAPTPPAQTPVMFMLAGGASSANADCQNQNAIFKQPNGRTDACANREGRRRQPAGSGRPSHRRREASRRWLSRHAAGERGRVAQPIQPTQTDRRRTGSGQGKGQGVPRGVPQASHGSDPKRQHEQVRNEQGGEQRERGHERGPRRMRTSPRPEPPRGVPRPARQSELPTAKKASGPAAKTPVNVSVVGSWNRIAFGRLVIAGTGIPTAVLAERFAAGDLSDELAADYGIERRVVEEAVRCETLRRAA